MTRPGSQRSGGSGRQAILRTSASYYGIARAVLLLLTLLASVVGGLVVTSAANASESPLRMAEQAYVYDASVSSAQQTLNKAAADDPVGQAISRGEVVDAAKPSSFSASGTAAKTATTGAGRVAAESAEAAVVHGNSRASTALTHLYRLEDAEGNLLKWGITNNLKGRYTQGFLSDKTLIPMTSGSRSNVLNLERWIVERDPGPLDLERWAGSMQ